MIKIATALVFVPMLTLVVIAAHTMGLFVDLMASAPSADQLAAHIRIMLVTGNAGAMLYALGCRLHLITSRRLGTPRPWVWRQVWWMSILLTLQFPAILPFGALAILLGLKSRELKAINVEPDRQGSSRMHC